MGGGGKSNTMNFPTNFPMEFPMEFPMDFHEAGRVPVPGDNVAIASRRLEAGGEIEDEGARYGLPHTVLEGHRFVRRPIAAGEALLSWGLPFGRALRPLAPGEYVCNQKILETLAQRQIDFPLPDAPNFADHLEPYVLNEAAFRPGKQVPPSPDPGTFMGYRRGGGRGVGTRNFLVILATTSRTGAFARTLAGRLHGETSRLRQLDGVVAITHTEGGAAGAPNNRELLLRTLAGWMVHPNVGAVLAVDQGDEPVNNTALRTFMAGRDYPLEEVPHSFFSIAGDFEAELARAAEMASRWLPALDGFRRTREPMAHLKLALQCGGSDAFSGVSGNPLAGWVAREVIRNGGTANLAETDELIGAEPYVLDNVKDLETARDFLHRIEAFKQRAAWHGHSAEGNPSAGNQFRGLYNIVLKSIGAARKKHPQVRLDAVIDYGQPMTEAGYYFMDSPGNDLESIAGQVASGANLILFITGNGSITNFPFVPTLKIVTTTGRFSMLANEMDLNAGRYQDGTPMEQLGAEGFQLAREVASGKKSLGEKAGHYQVSIWRDWRQTEPGRVDRILNAPAPPGLPLPVRQSPPPFPATAPGLTFHAYRTEGGVAADQVGLIVPTSLCSGQIAIMIAEALNAEGLARERVSRYVALAHSEGCGAAPGYSTGLLLETLKGHLAHPMVSRSLLLEHGCEQTVNDAMRHYLAREGLDVTRMGWASIQQDGGIDKVMAKARAWFAQSLAAQPPPPEEEVGLQWLRLGLTAGGEVGQAAGAALGMMALQIVTLGGLVVLPENSPLLEQRDFRDSLLDSGQAFTPTLGYGRMAGRPGLHVMATPTDHAVETLTGLGATGVEVMMVHVAGAPWQAHPMIPLLQVSADANTLTRHAKDLDLRLDGGNDTERQARALLAQVLEVASRRYVPHLFGRGNTDFQLTRGLLGLSL